MAHLTVKPGDLLKVTVSTPIEAEEAVAALLERSFRQPVALYTDEETLRTEVSVFLTSPRSWNPARREQLDAGLRRLRSQGVPLGRTHVGSARLRRRDWAEAWKRHFRPITIGNQLLVLPTWSRREPDAGQAVVRLDPGLSFGTGQHPTTAFCLAQIVACQPKNEFGVNDGGAGGQAGSGRGRPRPRHSAQHATVREATGLGERGGTADEAVRAPKRSSLLDIGCGSGILAIAAARLGYRPVEAFDLDPDAVRVAKENAALNAVTDGIELSEGDLTRMPLRPARRFDVVCANLLADLLKRQVLRITNRVSRGGTLVLAGILAAEFDEVCGVYADAGWRLVADEHLKEWRSGAFRQAVGA